MRPYGISQRPKSRPQGDVSVTIAGMADNLDTVLTHEGMRDALEADWALLSATLAGGHSVT